jgi:predicted dehydrogenase
MSSLPKPSRRTFLGTAAAAVLAAPHAAAANDTIQIGLIGTGGRCRQLLAALKRISGVRVVALCDVNDANLDATRSFADAQAFTTRHYREVLDRKDVQAVLIAAPDHWHVPMTVDACAAGKDVYVEKPLTHSRAEETAVQEAQDRHHRIVQVGMQQRSMPHIQKAKEIVKSGRLGQVHKVHLTWNRNVDRVRRTAAGIDPKKVDWKGFLGNAPDQPFDEYRLRSWRWFWDFGGGIFTDLMVHWVDVAHWLLDLDHPLKAVSIGSFVTAKDIWQTPDTVQTLLVYPGDIQVYFEGTFCNARNGAMLELMGSDATLYVDRGRYEIHPERGKGNYEELVLGNGKRGRDFYDKPDGEQLHLENWLQAIRGRHKPTAPVEAGIRSAAAAHLANEALRSGQVAVWKG